MLRTSPLKRMILKHFVLIIFFDLLFAISCDNSSTGPKANSQQRNILPVYEEGDNMDKYLWFPSGWMPDGQGISFNGKCTENPHSGKTCIKVGFIADKNSWVGIYWLANDSWEGPGINIRKYLQLNDSTSVKLTFWGRGKEGGENAQFKVGGVGDGIDSIKFPIVTDWIALKTNWEQYKINLSGQDLSNVVGGFCWVTNSINNAGKKEIWLYLDDIIYEVNELAH